MLRSIVYRVVCDRIGSIFGRIDSHAWRSRATHKHVWCSLFKLSLFARDISFQSAAIFLCPKGTTQISCGTITKCRKTRAMQRDFTIVDSLALRQCNTSMIPDTHLLKLLFLARYTHRSIYCLLINQRCSADLLWQKKIDTTIYTQKNVP